MQFLGGEQGETLAQVETHLVSEHAARACSGAVAAVGSLFHYAIEQF